MVGQALVIFMAKTKRVGCMRGKMTEKLTKFITDTWNSVWHIIAAH